jgi:hypothetical protein
MDSYILSPAAHEGESLMDQQRQANAVAQTAAAAGAAASGRSPDISSVFLSAYQWGVDSVTRAWYVFPLCVGT